MGPKIRPLVRVPRSHTVSLRLPNLHPKTHPHPYQHGPIGGPSRKLHLSAFLFRRRKLCAQPCMLDVLPRDRSNSKESLTWLANALSSHTAAAPWANARVSPNGAPHLYFTPVPGCPFAPISHPYGEMFTGDLFFPLPETLTGDFFSCPHFGRACVFSQRKLAPLLAQNVSRRLFPRLPETFAGDCFSVSRRISHAYGRFFCHRDWAIQPEGCLAHTWSIQREPPQLRHVTADCRLGLGAAGERAGQPSGNTLASTRAFFGGHGPAQSWLPARREACCAHPIFARKWGWG